jgi:hypothetical protein
LLSARVHRGRIAAGDSPWPHVRLEPHFPCARTLQSLAGAGAQSRTWFSGGKNDGKEQPFVTPGIVFGRTRLTDHVGLTVGAGVQIAVSQFHTNNHNIILSARLPF